MTTKYIKTDVEGLVKDPSSGAILNIDNEKLKAYKKQKQHFLNNLLEIEINDNSSSQYSIN